MPVLVILYRQVYVESLFICLFMWLDDCETHESVNCEKSTKDMKDIGEPPVLRRQERLFSIRSVHLLHRPCEDDSSVSKFLSAKQIINEFVKYCEE